MHISQLDSLLHGSSNVKTLHWHIEPFSLQQPSFGTMGDIRLICILSPLVWHCWRVVCLPVGICSNCHQSSGSCSHIFGSVDEGSLWYCVHHFFLDSFQVRLHCFDVG